MLRYVVSCRSTRGNPVQKNPPSIEERKREYDDYVYREGGGEGKGKDER